MFVWVVLFLSKHMFVKGEMSFIALDVEYKHSLVARKLYMRVEISIDQAPFHWKVRTFSICFFSL
jgi:hypothetical protein